MGLAAFAGDRRDRRIEIADRAQEFDAFDLRGIRFVERETGMFNFLEVVERQHGRLSGVRIILSMMRSRPNLSA